MSQSEVIRSTPVTGVWVWQKLKYIKIFWTSNKVSPSYIILTSTEPKNVKGHQRAFLIHIARNGS